MPGAFDISPDDRADLAFVADWLAAQFLTPPETARIAAAQSMAGQLALRRIGARLGEPEAAQALCDLLATGTAVELATQLQRRHTTLFEGIFRHRAIQPYASLWDGTGRLCGPAVGRMQAILRDLDMHLDRDCHEPADHLAIELAVLAEALRQGRDDCLAAALAELRGWSGGFAAALIAADAQGYYANMARLLGALIDQMAQARPATTSPHRGRDPVAVLAAAAPIGKDRL